MVFIALDHAAIYGRKMVNLAQVIRAERNAHKPSETYSKHCAIHQLSKLVPAVVSVAILLISIPECECLHVGALFRQNPRHHFFDVMAGTSAPVKGLVS